MQDHLLQHFPLGPTDLTLHPSGIDGSSAGFAGATILGEARRGPSRPPSINLSRTLSACAREWYVRFRASPRFENGSSRSARASG